MSKHKRRQPKDRGVKNSRFSQIFISVILVIGIIGGGIFAISSFNANAQSNQSEMAFVQPLNRDNGTDLAIPVSNPSSPSPPCVRYIIPPEEPRLETILSIDLTQEDGVPAFLEFLIVSADEVMFLDDGNIKPAQELHVDDRIHMQSGKVGRIQSVETELYTPEPIAVNQNGQSLRRVLAKSKRWTETILNLHTPTEVIETTPEHPFYVNDEWIEAKDLRPNDQINSRDGSAIRVVKTDEVHAPQYVYNLLVEGVHNFYVGKEGLLAHNCTDIPISNFPGVNRIAKGTGSDTLASVQDFVERAGKQQSKRPFENQTFGGTWNFLAEQHSQGALSGKLYAHFDTNGVVHGMIYLKDTPTSSGELVIEALEGLGQGSGAGTKLFQQAIIDSQRHFNGGIYLESTKAGYDWYKKRNPTRVRGKTFYWSPEDAAKLLSIVDPFVKTTNLKI